MAFRCLNCGVVLSDVADLAGHVCPKPDGFSPSGEEKWFRVEADYGNGFVFVGEASDRIGYLALADRAWKDGAKQVKLYECVRG